MDIILLEDIEKVGDKHEVVSVKPGYARNYLIPQGLALVANDTNRVVRPARLQQNAADLHRAPARRFGIAGGDDHARRSQAQRRRRRRVWLRMFSDRAGERSPDPATPDPRIQDDLQQEVRHILQRIPEKYRTVLVLRDLENFSTSDIAAILNRKETTIRWRLAEARNRFKELWEQREAGE